MENRKRGKAAGPPANACVDSYYPIGEDTGEAGMGMGADFDDDDYANEYDDDEEEGRRQVVQDWHQLVTCISDKVEEHNPLIGREQELDRTIQVLCQGREEGKGREARQGAQGH